MTKAADIPMLCDGCGKTLMRYPNCRFHYLKSGAKCGRLTYKPPKPKHLRFDGLLAAVDEAMSILLNLMPSERTVAAATIKMILEDALKEARDVPDQG